MKLLKTFILLSITAILWCNTALAENTRPLVIAAENYPPFEYLKDDKPVGIDVEIIQKIMDKLNVPVKFNFYPFARVNMLLKKGKTDAATSLSYKKEREKFLYYSDSQKAFATTGKIPADSMWTSEYVFFIKRQFADALHFDSYEQMRKDKYRVGVIRDYSYHQKFLDAKLDKYIYSNLTEALRALAKGVVDAVPFDRTIGLWLLKENNFENQLTFLSKPLFRKPYNLVFSKKSDFPNLKNIMREFNKELEKMHISGEIASINKKYTCTNNTYNTRPLTFVCENWKPFEYIEDDEIKGINAEVVDVIMKRLCIPYEIKIYPWSRAWMLAQKGKADVVLSISYKASREPFLYYTQEQREFPETGIIPSDYLWKSEYVFFTKKSKLEKIRFESYDQIVNAGYKVGINKDYSYNEKFRSVNFDNIPYNNTEDGLLALVAGDIDLYPMDKYIGLETLKSLGLSDSITYLQKKMFSKPYLAAFCRRSDYPRLKEIMQAFYKELNLMRNNGEYKKIHYKYMAYDIQ